MKMMKIGKGKISKEFWRMENISDRGQIRKRVGCWSRLHLDEDNARLGLLGLIVFLYLTCGAVLFHFIESEHELMERNQYAKILINFKLKYCSNISVNKAKFPVDSSKPERYPLRNGIRMRRRKQVDCKELDDLLDLRGNLSAAGLISSRPKWDWSGSFYFVGTVVSTIGFGMTTPRTTAGKAMVIVYGFFGCAGMFLLFNLFLERVVTLCAHILRYIHDRQRSLHTTSSNPKISVHSGNFNDSVSMNSFKPWRPSVYTVLLCLFLVSSILLLSAALVYKNMEHWTYFESIYFCFVSFSTIGLGDYVADQHTTIDNSLILQLYRFINFLVLTLGCCCVYSLFNVTSIIIRHYLNRLIRILDFPCNLPACFTRINDLRPPKPRTNSNFDRHDVSDSESEEDGENNGNMSLKEFLLLNKANLCLMQKHIVQSAQNKFQDGRYETSSAISARSVGPLAILSKKFGED